MAATQAAKHVDARPGARPGGYSPMGDLLLRRRARHGKGQQDATAFSSGCRLRRAEIPPEPHRTFRPGDNRGTGMSIVHKLHDEEVKLLARLRGKRRRKLPADGKPEVGLGNRVADKVATVVGSWPFIIVQSTLLALWMALNVTAYIQHWDPYPFILLNLALSFQAAYTAPIIMMSQNRQAAIDRQAAEHDYEVNLKAELEIELLHEKIDHLRETEVLHLIETIRELQTELRALRGLPSAG
jgi:uncharacterized membrane protein